MNLGSSVDRIIRGTPISVYSELAEMSGLAKAGNQRTDYFIHAVDSNTP